MLWVTLPALKPAPVELLSVIVVEPSVVFDLIHLILASVYELAELWWTNASCAYIIYSSDFLIELVKFVIPVLSWKTSTKLELVL